MGLTEDIADELALQALEIMEKTGDDQLSVRIAKVIGSSSTTMEEAFLTAIRVRRAEKRARELLANSQPKESPAAAQHGSVPQPGQQGAPRSTALPGPTGSEPGTS